MEADAAQDALDALHAEPRSVVSLICLVALLHVHVGSRLADFMAHCPAITTHLEATNRGVDLVGGTVDAGIRFRLSRLADNDPVSLRSARWQRHG